MTSYPPPPWQLVGDLFAAVVPVRRGGVAAAVVPSGHRLVSVAGWSAAVVLWAAYRPGGVLSYRELGVVLPVRRRLRLRATVSRIWVDSRVSRDGGRHLWAIPKELADIEVDAGSVFAVGEDGGVLADCSFRARVRLPGRWPVRFALAQPDGGRTRLVRVRGRGRLELGSAAVQVSGEQLLADLRSGRVVPAVALRGFVLVFGVRRWRTGVRRWRRGERGR